MLLQLALHFIQNFLTPFAAWTCPSGQCTLSSTLTCVSRPQQEMKMRLVPYREKHWLDRNASEEFLNWANHGFEWGPRWGWRYVINPLNLSGNASLSEGLLETWRFGSWHQVCTDPGFGEAPQLNMICEELGYRYGTEILLGRGITKPAISLGRCFDSEYPGQCTRQWNTNGLRGKGERIENVDAGACDATSAIHCSNYECLNSNVNQYFPTSSWQDGDWIHDAVFLKEVIDPLPYSMCECALACLSAGASACAMTCSGCFAGSSIWSGGNATGSKAPMAGETCYWSKYPPFRKTLVISPIDAAKDWNFKGEPNVPVIPSPCLSSVFVIKFSGTAVYSIDVEDGPIRHIMQGVLDCLFGHLARIFLTDTLIDVANLEWRIDFFFATDNETVQDMISISLDEFTSDRALIYERLPVCLDTVAAESPNVDVKFAVTIFKSYATKTPPLLDFSFDEMPPTGTTTSPDDSTDGTAHASGTTSGPEMASQHSSAHTTTEVATSSSSSYVKEDASRAHERGTWHNGVAIELLWLCLFCCS